MRYVDLVYAAAARQTRRDVHMAADVTQTVMLVMLNKARARRLPEERFMAGWLLQVTRYAVLQARRAAARRARHEAQAAKSTVATTETGDTESDVREALDAAILSLNRIDREVILRRHLRDESLAQIAAMIGANENTTGRRAARAMGKLRKLLEARGVTAPAAILAAVLGTELTVKAPAACASIPASGSAATHAAQRLIWKMTMTKLATAALISIVLFAGAGAIVEAILPTDGGKSSPSANPITAPPAAPLAASQPQPINVDIAKVIEGPSESTLKQVLAGLAENQIRLHSIRITATVTDRVHDFQAKSWLSPVLVQGQIWAQAGAQWLVRDQVTLGQEYILGEQGSFHRDVAKSYVEAWDGATLYRLYGPPLSPISAETFDTRYLHGEGLLAKQYSMQLPWDEETASDLHGTRKTIDRYPLAPAVLTQTKLSARHVLLSDGQDAMELEVVNPDTAIQRVETFWFDPQRGYGLLARRDATSLKGRIVRTITRRIDQLTEASPGIFYPSKAQMFWEEQGTPFQWEQFDASQVTANEPLAASSFHIDFPAGIQIVDFKDGRGTKR